MPISTPQDVVPFPAHVESFYLASGAWREGTVAGHLHDIAVANGERVALVTADTELTYAELDAVTDLRAAGLLALGLQPGDRVLLQIHNTAGTVVAWYSLLKAGLVPVCTLPLHRHHEISEIGRQVAPAAHLVAASNPRFDLVDFAVKEAADADEPRLILTIDGPASHGATSFESLGIGIDPAAARQTVEDVQSSMGPQSVVAYQLSGGTSGVPKVIPCVQAGYWAYSFEFARAMEWTKDHRVAYIGPVIHNAGIIIGLQGPHSVGATVVLGTPDLDSLFWTLIDQGATDVLLGPFAYDAVLDERMKKVSHLKRVLFSGKKVPESHFEALEAQNIWAGQVFGMGEGLCAVTPLHYPRSARLAGVGVPISEADEVRIYVPNTEEPVAPGEVGEMCARGPYTLRGYLNAPAQNATAFTSDGFYRSGDLMADRVIDGVRCLTVDGRIKDMISRGGEKISTSEVELLLVMHPAVSEAALVPMPDERLGERACAFISGPGDPIGIDELRAHLDGLGVAKYKWPERVIWLDEMPRASEVGKIDRRSLRRQASTLRVDSARGPVR
ncbi:2,3-dihydroxybenzoate-AMP ligase [Marmoricola sp. URHA0025 HA25]